MTRRTALACTALFSATIVTSGCGPHYTQLGQDLQLPAAQTVAVKDVLADPATYDGKTIRLAGKVHEVCQHKGCWVTLTEDGQKTVRVQFACPAEGRFVPADAAGRQAIVEGQIEVIEISEETARHYKEEAGGSAEEIAAIKGPQRTVRMHSAGLLLEDRGA